MDTPLLIALLVPVVLSFLMLSTSGDEGDLAAEPSEGDDVAFIETDHGDIVLMFHPEKAPNHVDNFKSLVSSGFYTGTRFHRTIPGFMVQGGDPNTKDLDKAKTWGTGGSTDEDGRAVRLGAEFNDMKHARGVLSMARSQDPDSASSQFFIMHQDSPHLDGQYSAFGRVVKGQEVVDMIAEMPTGDNGSVEPGDAVVLISVRIMTWPLDKKRRPWTINGWDGRG